jgi:hypothetical protein
MSSVLKNGEIDFGNLDTLDVNIKKFLKNEYAVFYSENLKNDDEVQEQIVNAGGTLGEKSFY